MELGIITALIVASVGSMGSSSVFRLTRGTDKLTKSQRSLATVRITSIHNNQSFSSSSITGVTVITFEDMVIIIVISVSINNIRSLFDSLVVQGGLFVQRQSMGIIFDSKQVYLKANNNIVAFSVQNKSIRYRITVRSRYNCKLVTIEARKYVIQSKAGLITNSCNYRGAVSMR